MSFSGLKTAVLRAGWVVSDFTGQHTVCGSDHTWHGEGDTFHVFHAGRHTVVAWLDPLAHAGESEGEGGKLTAPMPGKVVAVRVTLGDKVKKGQPLVIVEAMKMEHTIAAPADGVVGAINANVGDQVNEKHELIALK